MVSSPKFSPSLTLSNAGRITIFSGADGSVLRTIDGLNKTEQLGESLALADVNDDAAMGSLPPPAKTRARITSAGVQSAAENGRTRNLSATARTT